MTLKDLISYVKRKYKKLEKQICCLREDIQITNQTISSITNAVTQNFISDQDNLQLISSNSFYTFIGDSDVNWRLPNLTSSVSSRRTILNQGTGTITLVTFSGANDIYDTTSLVNTFTIEPGETYIFFNNSLNHVIIQ
jgi:hypothetical protein